MKSKKQSERVATFIDGSNFYNSTKRIENAYVRSTSSYKLRRVCDDSIKFGGKS